MAKRNRTASALHVTYHTRLGPNGRPRKNRDGSLSILTLVRVPKFKRVSRTFKTHEEAEAWAVPLAVPLCNSPIVTFTIRAISSCPREMGE